MTTTFELALQVPSVANAREHWAVKAARTKQQRQGVRIAAAVFGVTALRPEQRVTVRITRIAPRELDGDNLQAACKALRDGLADALAVDDRDPRVIWMYAQERGKPPAVRVEIRSASEA